MTKSIVLTTGIAAAIASTASAGFTGWSVAYVENGDGSRTYQVSLNVTTDQQYVFLNCFNYEGQAGAAMGATHQDNYSDPEGGVFGSWSPAATNLAWHNAGDSYVTATGNYGGGATGTALDPSFNDEIGDGLAWHAGWYDASPGTANNISMSTGSQRIMQITRNAGAVNSGDHVFWLRLGYKVANTTTALFGDGFITLAGVPAPGAIALVGLAGLTATRRRA